MTSRLDKDKRQRLVEIRARHNGATSVRSWAAVSTSQKERVIDELELIQRTSTAPELQKAIGKAIDALDSAHVEGALGFSSTDVDDVGWLLAQLDQ